MAIGVAVAEFRCAERIECLGIGHEPGHAECLEVSRAALIKIKIECAARKEIAHKSPRARANGVDRGDAFAFGRVRALPRRQAQQLSQDAPSALPLPS
jgi:hypothetical protein